MFGNRQPPTDLEDVPEVEVAARRGISIVWLIPLVAGAIAIWLGYTTLQEKGPTITITFANAEGLEAGKTKVKYKDVDVGLVDTVTISEDLSRIIVTASMAKGSDHYLNEGTKFWIVRPRIGAGGISGLGTLVSGAYVAVDPGEGKPTTSFTGLEEPPAINSDVAGRRFRLRAARLGSVSRGSPIYYHDIQVGQVLNYELADDQKSLDVDVFVTAPHDQLVRADSRFWNASGFDISLGTAGVDVSVESLQSLLAGGIAFDTPTIDRPGEQAAAGFVFPLFDNYRAVTEARYTEKVFYLVYFDGSVRGLRPGAPVEFRGMRVGSVTDVRLEINAKQDIGADSSDDRDRAGAGHHGRRHAQQRALRHDAQLGRGRAQGPAQVWQSADRRPAGRPRLLSREPAGQARRERHLPHDPLGADPARGADSVGHGRPEQARGAAAARAGGRSAHHGAGHQHPGRLARHQGNGRRPAPVDRRTCRRCSAPSTSGWGPCSPRPIPRSDRRTRWSGRTRSCVTTSAI